MARRYHWAGALVALALLCGGPALAADPTPEQRQKMADAHQRMADCLKSSRPIGECRSEMANACRQMVGEAACPMMGPGMMGPGTMGGGMMQPPATPPEAPKK